MINLLQKIIRRIDDRTNKVQTKILSSDTISTGVILTFNNLVPGRMYDVKGPIKWDLDGNNIDTARGVVQIKDGSIIVSTTHWRWRRNDDEEMDDFWGTDHLNFSFKATNSTMTVEIAGLLNMIVLGSNNRSNTYVQLEERNDLVETTDFT